VKSVSAPCMVVQKHYTPAASKLFLTLQLPLRSNYKSASSFARMRPAVQHRVDYEARSKVNAVVSAAQERVRL
jgi:hypothetical protein